MAMVDVDSGSLYRRTHSLVLGQRPLGTILHSSNEPGELSQWRCHDDSTINIVLELLLLIIIIIPGKACVRVCRAALVKTSPRKTVSMSTTYLLNHHHHSYEYTTDRKCETMAANRDQMPTNSPTHTVYNTSKHKQQNISKSYAVALPGF